MLHHIGTENINTDRLILRKFNFEDCNDMIEYWVSNEELQKLYGEPAYKTKDEVNSLLNKYITSYEKQDYYRWAIIEKKSQTCIGQIAYFLVDSKNNFAEIEYCIGVNFQKNGYATEATKAIIEFGFNKINLHKIQISAKSINIPSKRVIEKCNFKYEGTLRDYFFDDGKYIDRIYYSILKNEY